MQTKMSACVKAAGTDSTKVKGCKRSPNVKAGLASSLGKPVADITDTDLEAFATEAGKDAVNEAMSACMEVATDATSRAACKTVNAKAAMTDALGVEAGEIGAADIEEFVRAAANKGLGDKMEFCMGRAATEVHASLAPLA